MDLGVIELWEHHLLGTLNLARQPENQADIPREWVDCIKKSYPATRFVF